MVSVDIQNTRDPAGRTELIAVVEHLPVDRPGDWRVSINDSQANDKWEMKIVGPNGFERSYTLEGAAGEHRADVIRALLERMLPPRASVAGR